MNGITGYNFDDIHTSNDDILNILYNDGTNINYIINDIMTTTTAYTWKLEFNSISWNNYIPIFENISSITYIIKRKVSLENGNGNGDTYWNFYAQSATYNHLLEKYNVTYEGDIKPKLFINDLIYIEQNPNNINPDYNGITKIINVEESNNGWKITTSQKYLENSFDTGKIVNYLKLQKDRNEVHGPNLYFQDFNFNFNFIDNTATTLITGYVINYDTILDKDNNSNNGFYHGNVSLPWKELYFKRFGDSGNYIYNMNCDLGYYEPNYYINNSLSNIIGSKTINKIVEKNSTTQKLGGIEDLWGLNGLEEYYPEIDPITSNYLGFEQNKYNPKIIQYVNNNLRVSLNFILKNNISQKIYLKNLKVKIYYFENDIPQWLKGTWLKGTWYNGDFYNGLFKSGLWIKGNFYNGNMSCNYR
jgi:hypothetical protein